MMENLVLQNAEEALAFVQAQLDPRLQNPSLGIICGSGLGGLADNIIPHPQHAIEYRDIPHFPQSTG